MALVDPEIILSISIPSYNRAGYLKRCLSSIFHLNNTDRLPVEVSVYDNCSTDNTQEVVEEFIKEGFSFRYDRSPATIDGNLNIYQCYARARGRYVLVLGDDDVIVAGALTKLVEFLGKGDIGAIYLNHTSIVKFDYKQHTNGLKFNRYAYPIDFVRKVHYNMTFISANVVRNPQIDDKLPLRNENLNFSQIPIILDATFSGNPSYFCKTIVMAAQPNESVGYDVIEVFLVNLRKVIFNTKLDNSIQKRVEKVITKELAVSFFPHWIRQAKKSNGVKHSDSSLRNLRQYYRYNAYYYIFILPGMMLPDVIAKRFLKLVSIYARIRSKCYDVLRRQ